MSNPLISIIVPVYNTEKYLPKCIESILAQTYTNYELILVDDGSSDRCPGICDEYADKDTRIKVIHKENGGVGAARNMGILAAQGNYLLFFDSDDYILQNAFERISKLLLDSSADVICFGYYQENEENGKLIEKTMPQKFIDNIPTELALSIAFDGYINYPGFIRVHPTLCNKSYKRETILKNNIRFDEHLSKAEDLLFNVSFFCVAKTAYMSNESFYIYRSNPNSLTHTYYSFEEDRIQKGVYLYSQIKDIFDSHLTDKKQFNSLLAARLGRIAININEEIVTSNMTPRECFTTIKRITEWLIKYIDRYNMSLDATRGAKFRFERMIVRHKCTLLEYIYAIIMTKVH